MRWGWKSGLELGVLAEQIQDPQRELESRILPVVTRGVGGDHCRSDSESSGDRTHDGLTLFPAQASRDGCIGDSGSDIRSEGIQVDVQVHVVDWPTKLIQRL